MSSSYTEDQLVEQPAIQLMQHELGWEVGENIEHRTPNIERRSEEKREKRAALQRLNPDLPVDHSSPTILLQGYERQGLRMAGAIEPFFAKASKVKAVEEICRDRTVLSLAEETVVHGNIGVHGVREHLNIVNIMLAERS
jgi:hypothetical protein